MAGKNYRKNSVLFSIAGTLPSIPKIGKKLQMFSTIKPKPMPEAAIVMFDKNKFDDGTRVKTRSNITKQRASPMISSRTRDIESFGTGSLAVSIFF
ncbi:MAG TPA: hypothetical protein VGF44_12525 [Terriglobales bacterium]